MRPSSDVDSLAGLDFDTDDGSDQASVESYESSTSYATSATCVSSTRTAVEEEREVTWKEVFAGCDCRQWTWRSVAWGILAAVGALVALYWFLFALDLLSSGARVLTGCVNGELYQGIDNPISGVTVGILSTALLQSSSTTTSIIVTLVGSDVLHVNQAIYMVMGANIGTSVTNTLVAMGQAMDKDQLERAFTGATVHDMFNFMTVAVLLPVEVLTGYLAALTAAIASTASTTDGSGLHWIGPIKRIVGPLTSKVILANSGMILAVADGTGDCSLGGGYYPIQCEDPSHPTAASCPVRGLIDCDRHTGDCPVFFQASATEVDDKLSGGVVFLLGICLLFVSLFGLIYILQYMLMGVSTRMVYKATNVNGYVAILLGAAITTLVQSSSITTSTLTPLVGLDLLRIEQMYPLTLGANLGTTVTAILAAMVTEGTAALQVALAHLFFNVTGVLMFYPIPFMRRIPVGAATQLGRATRHWRPFPIVYIVTMFFLVPLFLLGLSFLFELGSLPATILASCVTATVGSAMLWLAYWARCRNANLLAYLQAREHRREAVQTVATDLKYLQTKVRELMHHVNLNWKECQFKLEQPTGWCKAFERRRMVIRNLADDMDSLKEKMAALLDFTGRSAGLDEDTATHISDPEQAPPSLVCKSSSGARLCGVGLWFPGLYCLVLLVFGPLIGYGLWGLFERGQVGATTLASCIAAIVGVFFLWLLRWCLRGGQQKCHKKLHRWRQHAKVMSTLPDDLELLKMQVVLLAEHTGMSFDEDDEE